MLGRSVAAADREGSKLAATSHFFSSPLVGATGEPFRQQHPRSGEKDGVDRSGDRARSSGSLGSTKRGWAGRPDTRSLGIVQYHLHLQQKCYYGSNASLTVHSYSCILVICKSVYSDNSAKAIPPTLSLSPAHHFKVTGSAEHVG